MSGRPKSADDRAKERWFERLDQLNSGGGDGIYPSMSEESLKPRVDFLHTAFLWMAGALVTVLVAVMGVIFATSTGTNARIDRMGESVSAVSREVGVVGAKIDDTNRLLERIDAKLDARVTQGK